MTIMLCSVVVGDKLVVIDFGSFRNYASAASFVNGLAGNMAQKKNGFHIVATDLIDFIPSVMKPFDKVIR